VLKPAAVLLDEPTANLDPYNVGLIEEIIRGHGSTTVVLVTHNTFQAKRLADRVGLLLGGKLIELLPTAVFEAPIDPHPLVHQAKWCIDPPPRHSSPIWRRENRSPRVYHALG
jgi:ABC-type transporter Mla maintaining outer membrane lipid asymmetry ATPase subunit MlaF